MVGYISIYPGWVAYQCWHNRAHHSGSDPLWGRSVEEVVAAITERLRLTFGIAEFEVRDNRPAPPRRYDILSPGSDYVLGTLVLNSPLLSLVEQSELLRKQHGRYVRLRKQGAEKAARVFVVYTNADPFDTVPRVLTDDEQEARETVEAFKARGIPSHFIAWGRAPEPMPRDRKHDVHLFKWVPDSLRGVREDADSWKFMGDLPTEELALHNIESAARNGHDYAYLAW